MIAGVSRVLSCAGSLRPQPRSPRPTTPSGYESHAIGLDRNEVGSLLVAAGLGAPNEHALISLLAINGLRISEALGADIAALGLERGHRTLTVLGKGSKIVTVPLAPAPRERSTLPSANDLTDRPSYDPTANGWTATAPAGSCAAPPAEPASTNQSVPTPCATPSSPQPSTPAVPLRDVQEAASRADPRTTMRYDRARVSLDRHATYIVAAYLAGAAR